MPTDNRHMHNSTKSSTELHTVTQIPCLMHVHLTNILENLTKLSGNKHAMERQRMVDKELSLRLSIRAGKLVNSSLEFSLKNQRRNYKRSM